MLNLGAKKWSSSVSFLGPPFSHSQLWSGRGLCLFERRHSSKDTWVNGNSPRMGRGEGRTEKHTFDTAEIEEFLRWSTPTEI